MDFVRLVPEMLPDVLKLLGEKGIRVRLPLEELELLLEEEKEHEEEIHIEESGEQSEIADIPLPQISWIDIFQGFICKYKFYFYTFEFHLLFAKTPL